MDENCLLKNSCLPHSILLNRLWWIKCSLITHMIGGWFKCNGKQTKKGGTELQHVRGDMYKFSSHSHKTTNHGWTFLQNSTIVSLPVYKSCYNKMTSVRNRNFTIPACLEGMVFVCSWRIPKAEKIWPTLFVWTTSFLQLNVNGFSVYNSHSILFTSCFILQINDWLQYKIANQDTVYSHRSYRIFFWMAPSYKLLQSILQMQNFHSI